MVFCYYIKYLMNYESLNVLDIYCSASFKLVIYLSMLDIAKLPSSSNISTTIMYIRLSLISRSLDEIKVFFVY